MNYRILFAIITLLSLKISAIANVSHLYDGGAIYEYNKKTKKFDITTNFTCSLELQLVKVYWDTEHGDPRDQVLMEYKISTDANIDPKYLSHMAESSTCDKLPDQYCSPTINVKAYFEGLWLTSGTQVSIHFSSVYYKSDIEQFDTQRPNVDRFQIAKTNSASSYSGGDTISSGYQCRF